MIGRSVTLFAAVLACACGAPRAPIAFAQEQAPAAADAPAARPAGAAEAAAAAPAIETTPDPREYRIGPEDVLEIAVWKNPDLTRERVPVRPDGKVSLPLVNDIQAAGLTANELRGQLAQRLSPFIQNPEVSVMVREMNSFKVSVTGNVAMPGQYHVRSEATVLDMISRAQGFNAFADKGSIRVIRRDGESQRLLKFNYNDAIDAKPGANFLVQPGDVVIVD
jgi:polysaccharide export outer membrane protein